ncbi:hypothetical protein Poli38472_006147 [Pythium oligandrum]|uniref:glucan endo-1,3-beta-D-glucosidase n=1 Tax=Pythium oligandrum TaxID=41045 RepID=A0A8K1CSC8_PYTOL|nr:hypothetical protein Poli38472_006147 [Pythium oligandrum]|eukprot:TMW68679.1 hypothetical protein Poli38472_006147 [Pythium oligandrum]
MLTTSGTPPPSALFAWTDALQELIRPNNVPLLGLNASERPPIPTNDWWGNLLAWKANERDSDPIFANPYVYLLAKDRGLSLSYLHDYRVDGPVNENDAIKYYFYPATIKNLVLSATEWTPSTGVQMEIQSWDDMGVTLSLSEKATTPHTSVARYAKTYLSMGNAFTTMEYRDLHAQLQSDHGILTVNNVPIHENQVVTGESFVIEFNNGHKWLAFYYPDNQVMPGQRGVQLRMHHNTLITTAPFTGILQVTYVSSTKDHGVNEHAILDLYRSAAGVYPVATSLFVQDADSFGYEWTLRDAQQGEACRSETHLHFALRHLQQMMDTSYVIKKPELALWSHTRGIMQAYTIRATGDGKAQWRFHALQDISAAVDSQATSFLPRGRLSAQDVQELRLVDILTQEIVHADWNAAIPHEGSYYFKGKSLQKFGSMVLIAKELAETTTPELTSVWQQGLQKYRVLLEKFFKNRSAFPLVYDTLYKGIITSEPFKRRDLNVDFGNGAYNDHHYHYGYLIAALAILLHLEGDQAQPANAELRVFVETLIRDVANADPKDQYFPRFRNFNWFLGHSYSHGVTPMADGKDEESTSEEINFLYGLALYGHVTHQQSLTSLAKLMLKVNTVAIRTYFLMTDDSTGIHPPRFIKNKVTGICFDNKCDYATWFSPNRECIHGIQMLPVSPMLDVVRSRAFIQEEWEQILAKLDCVQHWDSRGSGWTSLLYSNAAVLNPDRACEVLSHCPMDDGLSRAWALYMARSKRKGSLV